MAKMEKTRFPFPSETKNHSVFVIREEIASAQIQTSQRHNKYIHTTVQNVSLREYSTHFLLLLSKVRNFIKQSHKMLRKSEACSDCAKNCVLVHQKKNGPTSRVNRFFKLMYGKDRSEVLYLPPKFARTVRDMVDQVAQIEDSNGKKSYVRFSNVQGSLVLEEGWPVFYREHGLKFGDLVVFNYMKKGQFVVHIYDSSACERTYFDPKRPRIYKRSRPNPERVLHHEQFQSIGVDLMDTPNTTTPSQNGGSNRMARNTLGSYSDLRNTKQQHTCINLEEPIYMLNRDTDCPVEDRNFLHDLSSFEMKKTALDTNDNEKSLDYAGLETDEAQVIGGHYDDVNLIADMQDHVFEDSNVKTRVTFQGDRMLTSVAESPFISSTRVTEQEIAFTTESFGLDKQASAIKIKEELVESREEPLTSVRASHASEQGNACVPKLPDFSLLSATPGDFYAKYAAIEKEITDSREKVLLITSVNEVSHSTSSFLHNAPAKYAAIKKEIMEPREKLMPSVNASPYTTSMLYNVPAKLAATVKKETMEPGKEVYGSPRTSYGNLPTIGMQLDQTSSPSVKIEPGLSYDSCPIVATSFFSAEVKSQSYLALPVRIPFSPRNALMGQGRVVFIIDANRRSWPMFYSILFCVRAFTEGWRCFCEVNNVELGKPHPLLLQS